MDAYNFWKRFDEKKGDREIKDICKTADIAYQRIADQRSDCRLPRLEDAFVLASEINVSLEYLLTGNSVDNQRYSARALKVAAAFDDATERRKESIEELLDILPLEKNNSVSKAN